MARSLMRLKLSLFRLSPTAHVHEPQLVGCSLRLVWIQTIAAAPRSGDRVSVESPTRRALRLMVPGLLPRARAPEDRMDRQRYRARHIHCVETRGALFVLSVMF